MIQFLENLYVVWFHDEAEYLFVHAVLYDVLMRCLKPRQPLGKLNESIDRVLLVVPRDVPLQKLLEAREELGAVDQGEGMQDLFRV